ncbi:hypothetical protein PGB90_009762 [Kerria lacca]
MTTIFPKNPLKLLTNGVVNDQFNNCNEIPASSPPVSAPSPSLTSSTTPTLSLSNETSVENVTTVVKSQMRSQSQDEPQQLDILINNVVCSFSLGCHLNLRQIALNGHNVEFRRESGMVTMKLRKPQITASVWSSGKITCTGATSEDEAKSGARRIARVIQKLGFNAKFRKMRIVNVLGSCSMPFEIKINAFSQRFREAEYEPELHPGVTYKVKNLKATLKIFSTGSITVTAPSVPNVQSAIEHIYPLVLEFRKEFTNKEDMLRKRTLAQQLINQDKLKRKRLNSNSCSSNDEEDKEVESIMSR